MCAWQSLLPTHFSLLQKGSSMCCSSSVDASVLVWAALGCSPSGMSLSDIHVLECLLSEKASSALSPAVSFHVLCLLHFPLQKQLFLHMCELDCEQGLPCLPAFVGLFVSNGVFDSGLRDIWKHKWLHWAVHCHDQYCPLHFLTRLPHTIASRILWKLWQH